MATKTTTTGTSIEIEAIAADWYPANADPNGLGFGADEPLRVRTITFYPAAADDTLVIKNSKGGTDTDATAEFWVADADRQPITKYYGPTGKLMWPFIDESECTFNASSRVLIDLAQDV